MNLNDEDVVGMHGDVEMGLGLGVSLCGKYAAGVNDDAGVRYCPMDFPCPSEGLRSRVVRVRLALRMPREQRGWYSHARNERVRGWGCQVQHKWGRLLRQQGLG